MQNPLIFAERADIDYMDLYNLEEKGIATDRTIRKVFSAIEAYQRRALTPNEKEHLLSERPDPNRGDEGAEEV